MLFYFILACVLSSVVFGASIHEKRATVPEDLMVYGYNPPRVNPTYCVGFHINYPTYPGQAFEAGSIQELHWSVDQNITNTPNIITRIRILNATEHNMYTIAENISKVKKKTYIYLIINTSIALYNDEVNHTGSITFPLMIKEVSGLYHYRFMVNYVGTSLHCVYQTIPFFVIQDPKKKYVTGQAPYAEPDYVGRTFSTIPILRYDIPA